MIIKLLKEAQDTYPAHDHYFAFAFNANELASFILLSMDSHHPLDQHLPSADEAFDSYRQLKKCDPAALLSLLSAVKAWVQNAKKYNHSSVIEAYQTALTALDHFTSLNSSLDSRHEVMQARVDNLANIFMCYKAG